MADALQSTDVLQLVTLDSILQSLDPAVVSQALASSLEYVHPPERAVDGGIRATLAAPTRARHAKQRPPAGATVHLALRRVGSSHQVVGHCTCTGGGYLCPHVATVTLDLAMHTGLREALASGRPVAAHVAELPALRAQFARRLQLVRTLQPWLVAMPPGQARATVLYTLAVLVPTSNPWDPQFSLVPMLELRARLSGTRHSISATELPDIALPPEDRRILEVCAPAGSRKAFHVTGALAALVLEWLRARGAEVLGEDGKGPLTFATVPLNVRIDRDSMPRHAADRLRDEDPFDDDGDDMLYLPPPLRRGRAGVQRDETPVDALVARWVAVDQSFEVPVDAAVYFGGTHAWVWVPARRAFYPVDAAVDPDVAAALQRRPAIPVASDDRAEVYAMLRASFRGRTVTLPSPESMGLPPNERPDLVLRVDGRPLDVRVALEARYSFGVFSLGAAAPYSSALESRRDADVEEAAVQRVAAAAGLRAPDDDPRVFAAADDDAVRFWTEGLPALRGEGSPRLTVLVADALRRVRVGGTVRSRVRVARAADWLETSVGFTVEDHAVEMEVIRRAVLDGHRWVALDDGTLARLGAETAALAGEAAEVIPEGAAHALLPAHQLGRLDRWLEVASAAEVDPAVAALRTKLRALAVAPDPEPPRGLRAALRPYQRAGLAWLQFLDALGAGGLLADDMGLGKTVMTLALLQWRKERDGAAPSLVVCPTSVAGNWVREAARFAPDLRVVLLHGAGRDARRAEIAAADVAVTTYALLRRDVDALAGERFRYAILDEAQNVKNADAATTLAARRLVAERRLALTGTPVENHLGELWSVMEYCNPGMLGSARAFEARFERPVAADPRGPAAEALRALIRPFVLRRKKRDVLTDLPAKEEIDLGCEATAAQRRLYDALAASLRESVEGAIARDGLAKSGLSILTALLRLRQMACDPRLVEPTARATASAKRAAFLDLVAELAAEGRRALVFSQFVELLTLWRADLDRAGIAYEYLDGKTRDRDAVVARFQQGAAPLFLISLKAGGTGLNLTAADTVIHCDPWWNPAVEDQATDRAHRIGQAHAVTVYRLVARGTVEEKIMALKARKRQLADAVIHADAGALKGLSADDVRALLGGLEGDAADDGADDGDDPAAAPPEPAPRGGTRPNAAAALVTGAELARLRKRAAAWLARPGNLQKDLAQRSGVAAPYVSMLVTGRAKSLRGDLAARLRGVIDGG